MSDQPSAWVLPHVKGPVVGSRGRGTSVGALAENEREAWRVGFEQGRQEGLAAAELATGRQLAGLTNSAVQLDAICRQLARPVESMDDQAARELAALALSVGGHLARRDLCP